MRKINYKEFGGRLDYLIREKGISLRELGRRTGIAPETICQWRYARQNISRTVYVAALCKEFNVKAEWLLYGRIGE